MARCGRRGRPCRPRLIRLLPQHGACAHAEVHEGKAKRVSGAQGSQAFALRAAVFYLDLRRHGSGKHERWLVSEFAPAPSSGSTAPGIGEGASDLHISLPTSGTSKSPLSATWLLLPLSAFSLIFLVPLGLGVRGFVRNRRAMREYEAAGTYRSTSSPS